MPRIVLGFALAVLSVAWLVGQDRNLNPLAPTYAPRGLGGVIAASYASLVLVHVAAGQRSRRVLLRALVAVVIALGLASCAYGWYDSQHPDPLVPDGFRGYLEPRAAFHRQLAPPGLAAGLGILAILGRPGATGGRARPR